MNVRYLPLTLGLFFVGCSSSGGGEGGLSAEGGTSNVDSTTTVSEDGGESGTGESAEMGDGDGDAGDGDGGDGDAGDGDGGDGDAGDGDAGDGDGGDGDAGDGDTGDGDTGDGDTGDGDTGDGDTGDGDGDTGDGDGDTGDGDGDDIEVVITGDNAYGFGFGSSTAINTYYGDVVATLAGQIFNCNGGPEVYTVPASEADNAEFLYIVAWRDNAVTHGVLGRFQKIGGGGTIFGDTIHTADEGWEVCATGHEYVSPSPGPDQAAITAALVECNSGSTDTATTSGGWVDAVGTVNGRLAVGELNDDAGGDFPIVCSNTDAENYMPPEARWMWFDWDPGNTPNGPFRTPGGAGNFDHQFHIFRLAATNIPLPE